MTEIETLEKEIREKVGQLNELRKRTRRRR